MIKELQILKKHQKEWEQLYKLIPYLQDAVNLDRAINERQSTLTLLDRKIEKATRDYEAHAQGCADKIKARDKAVAHAADDAKDMLDDAEAEAKVILDNAKAEAQAEKAEAYAHQDELKAEAKHLKAQADDVRERFLEEQKKLHSVEKKIKKLKDSI